MARRPAPGEHPRERHRRRAGAGDLVGSSGSWIRASRRAASPATATETPAAWTASWSPGIGLAVDSIGRAQRLPMRSSLRHSGGTAPPWSTTAITATDGAAGEVAAQRTGARRQGVGPVGQHHDVATVVVVQPGEDGGEPRSVIGRGDQRSAVGAGAGRRRAAATPPTPTRPGRRRRPRGASRPVRSARRVGGASDRATAAPWSPTMASGLTGPEVRRDGHVVEQCVAIDDRHGRRRQIGAPPRRGRTSHGIDPQPSDTAKASSSIRPPRPQLAGQVGDNPQGRRDRRRCGARDGRRARHAGRRPHVGEALDVAPRLGGPTPPPPTIAETRARAPTPTAATKPRQLKMRYIGWRIDDGEDDAADDRHDAGQQPTGRPQRTSRIGAGRLDRRAASTGAGRRGGRCKVERHGSPRVGEQGGCRRSRRRASGPATATGRGWRR